MTQLESMKMMTLASDKKYRDRLGKIGNNTYARFDPHTLTAAVFLHGNLIATSMYTTTEYADPELEHATKILTVRTAGWNTPTTRDRINAFLADNGVPHRAWQQNHRQMLTDRNDWEDKENIWEYSPSGEYFAKFAFLFDIQKWVNVDWNLET